MQFIVKVVFTLSGRWLPIISAVVRSMSPFLERGFTGLETGHRHLLTHLYAALTTQSVVSGITNCCCLILSDYMLSF